MRVFIILVGVLSLVSCVSGPSAEDNQPPPTNLPTAPNCAADGPDCKQFNPDLNKKKHSE